MKNFLKLSEAEKSDWAFDFEQVIAEFLERIQELNWMVLSYERKKVTKFIFSEAWGRPSCQYK